MMWHSIPHFWYDFSREIESPVRNSHNPLTSRKKHKKCKNAQTFQICATGPATSKPEIIYVSRRWRLNVRANNNRARRTSWLLGYTLYCNIQQSDKTIYDICDNSIPLVYQTRALPILAKYSLFTKRDVLVIIVNIFQWQNWYVLSAH